MRKQGKVALITGASGGIGRGIALGLADEGVSVALNYRSNSTAAQAVQAEAQQKGVSARTYQCDIGSGYQPVKEMVERVIEDFGQLDILINNSGTNLAPISVADMTPDDLKYLFKSNFFGPFYCTKAAIPYLRYSEGPNIIFISSIIVNENPSSRMPYSSSKSAVESLAKAVASEERKNGIRVNIVRPGLVESAMGDAALLRRGLGDRETAAAIAPFGRLCTAADIGNAVVFLCSEKGSYITASTLTVDGGPFDWLPPRVADLQA